MISGKSFCLIFIMMGEALKVCVGVFLLVIEMIICKLIRILVKMVYFI